MEEQPKQKLKTLRIPRPRLSLGKRTYRIENKETTPPKWLEVTVDAYGSGTVNSNWKTYSPGSAHDPVSTKLWIKNLKIDAVETLLLALGCAGIDLDAPEFIQGVEAALAYIEKQ